MSLQLVFISYNKTMIYRINYCFEKKNGNEQTALKLILVILDFKSVLTIF